MASQTDPIVLHGDSLHVLAGMPDCSVDAVVCDPPYGLADLPAFKIVDALTRWLAGDRAWVPDGAGFMGKGWDRFVPPPALWDQVHRVLKPGGYLLAFAGARTHDLMGMSIRLAGFDTRDSIVWHHGSGMPHGLDVSKAMDDRFGNTRQVTPVGPPQKRMIPGAAQDRTGSWIKDDGRAYQPAVTTPVAADAARWDGWNTALKPASEPIVVARKPFTGTVADNVLVHGVGALNVDGCRIAPSGPRPGREGLGVDTAGKTVYGSGGPGGGSIAVEDTMLGRWPANVVLTHSAGCRNVGVRQVQTNTHHPSNRPAGKDGWGHTGQTGLTDIQVRSEQVDDWVCVDGCPVRALDDQSGETGAQGDVPPASTGCTVASTARWAQPRRVLPAGTAAARPGSSTRPTGRATTSTSRSCTTRRRPARNDPTSTAAVTRR